MITSVLMLALVSKTMNWISQEIESVPEKEVWFFPDRVICQV